MTADAYVINGINKMDKQTENFLKFKKKAIEKFGDKYDYSKAEYVDSKTDITIICPMHGEFKQTPHNHLLGKGCIECQKDKAFEEFKKKANEKFDNKYDYSKANYVNAHTDIVITCPIHGDFTQTPDTHLHSKGCKLCCKKDPTRGQQTTESFIERAHKIHGDKYDYSQVEYVRNSIPVKIICPEHGVFMQSPNSHLNGRGCPECSNKKPMTKETFIEKARNIHGDKYDYSKVIYVNNSTPVNIICPEHGDFIQTPHNHLSGQQCPKCSTNYQYTTEEFIAKAKKVHEDKYDYSKVEYKDAYTKVKIICPEHGEFEIGPSQLLSGSGCQKCNSSRLEQEIIKLLDTNKIIYNIEKTFPWLGQKRLDFYLPDYKIAIECQGEQHYKPIDFFGGEERFLTSLKRDKSKKESCKNNGVKLLYFSKLMEENKRDSDTFFNTNELLKEIKKYGKINE